jgi:rubredoxin
MDRQGVVRPDMRTEEVATAATPHAGVALPPLEEFFTLFRDDNDCLEFLWRSRCSTDGQSALCPECAETREFRTDLDETARLRWRCEWCGYFLSPVAGTIFQGSQTPLHVFFDAIGVLGDSGRSAPIEELAYELGITFGTAAEVTRLLAGRLEARASSSPRFAFDISDAKELAFSN